MSKIISYTQAWASNEMYLLFTSVPYPESESKVALKVLILRLNNRPINISCELTLLTSPVFRCLVVVLFPCCARLHDLDLDLPRRRGVDELVSCQPRVTHEVTTHDVACLP